MTKRNYYNMKTFLVDSVDEKKLSKIYEAESKKKNQDQFEQIIKV